MAEPSGRGLYARSRSLTSTLVQNLCYTQRPFAVIF